MKNRINLLGIIAIVAIIGLGFTACDDGGGNGTGGGGGTTVAVTGVSVAPTTLALTVGGSTGTLTPTIAPVNAANKAVTWSTSNATVATVNNGVVTAVSAGTATITVTTTDGSKTATCAVTVIPPLYDPSAADGTTNIGKSGPGGGIIFYYNVAGFNVDGLGTCYYLEAAPTNQATSVRWSNTDENVKYAGVTEIGTGKANTAAIIAVHSDDTASNNAAKAAVSCTSGGKNDWFLPSSDELYEMYKARTHLGISSGYFWSSSQYSSTMARNRYFGVGNFSNSSKSFEYNVRAIRAF